MLASADRFIVTAGDGEMLAEAAPDRPPVALFELPRWYDDLPGGQAAGRRRAVALSAARPTAARRCSSMSPGRFVDWLTTRGLLYRPRDLEALYRSLEARGLVIRLGAETPVAAPRPLDDLPRVVARVRELLTEVTQAGLTRTRRPAAVAARRPRAWACMSFPPRPPLGPASRADAAGQPARAA